MLRLVIMALALLAAGAIPALAEKRVALVIGNSAYQNVVPLVNPSNDAKAIAATLTKAGFDSVDERLNLSGIETKRALREFGAKVRDADVAVIYYAGHGIELDGTNYLIPTDAKLEVDTDVLDEAFPLDRFVVAADPAKQLRLVILDACRDNPFNKTMKRTIGSRAISRGLAKVEPTNPNTLIAFAAKAGSTAADGEGKNSPFATALMSYVTQPGLDLRKAFGFVRDDVLKVTNNKQEPFVYGSLGGNDVSLVPAIAAPVATGPAASGNDALVQRAYELALQVGNKAVWDTFIAKYPSGLYTELAKAQRDKVRPLSDVEVDHRLDGRRDRVAVRREPVAKIHRVGAAHDGHLVRPHDLFAPHHHAPSAPPSHHVHKQHRRDQNAPTAAHESRR